MSAKVAVRHETRRPSGDKRRERVGREGVKSTWKSMDGLQKSTLFVLPILPRVSFASSSALPYISL